MQTIETTFESQGLRCAGTLMLPANTVNPPVIVMAHGFACVRAMNLPDLAERFVAAGYATFLFDYRNFGDSEGLPRHWVDPKRHQQDWLAAIQHLRTLPQIDTGRMVLWGTSLSGGHVLTLASQGIAVQAVIAQFPHVSGLATLARLHPLTALKLTAAGLLDDVGEQGSVTSLPEDGLLQSDTPGAQDSGADPGARGSYRCRDTCICGAEGGDENFARRVRAHPLQPLRAVRGSRT